MTTVDTREPVHAVSLLALSLPAADVAQVRSFFKSVTRLTKTLIRRERGRSARVWHFAAGGDPQFLRRRDFLRVQAVAKPPSEQLACCLGMLQGFRGGEILRAKYSHVELEEGTLWVDDSKKHKLYPLGLRKETAYAYDRVPEAQRVGYVLKRAPRFRTYRGMPMSTVSLSTMVKRWAYDAGVPNWREWKAQLFRRYFAKDWVSRGGDVVLLSRVMRHTSPFTTWLYLQRLVFLEDVEAEMRWIYGDDRVAATKLKEVEP